MKYFFFIFFTTLSLLGTAQSTIKGRILDEASQPLMGATIKWKHHTPFAISDSLGFFNIEKVVADSTLVVQYVGFNDQEFIVNPKDVQMDLILSQNIELKQVEVKSKRADSYTPLGSNMNKEVISTRELRKAPCCNLSESFETSAVVDANYTNAALGTREIEILGLRGIYSQIMLDSRPTLYNFSAPFAFDYIPGPWLKGVQVSKGAGTVVNGAEGLAGQINVDLVDPRDGPRLFLNGYANHRNRFEGNLVSNHRLNEHVSVGTLIHANSDRHHQDQNDDAFLDAPQKRQLNVMQRLHYYGLKWEGQINVHGILDHRNGGQTHHPDPGHTESLVTYNQENKRLELFGNVGYIGFKDPGRSIGFQWHVNNQTYDALYARQANGKDESLYTNLIYEDKLNSTKNKINAGLSFRASNTQEGFSDFIFDRKEVIPGAFMEYSRNADDAESIFGYTLGLRADRYDEYGLRWTPRFSMRLATEPGYGTLRASAGRAYRMPNIISDNIHFIGTGRYYDIDSIGLDVANNYGLSYIHKIFIGGPAEWNISFDAYHTYFVHQNIQDIESALGKISNRYIDAGSRINYILIQNQFQLNSNVGFKLAYKYTDAKYRLFNDEKLITRLYLPKHRALATLDLSSNESKWIGNLTFQWIGSQRLLDVSAYPTPGSKGQPDKSPAYVLINVHLSRNLGKWEVYLGSENLTNYVQPYQIVSSLNAGSRYFDATRLYAPNMGMRAYAGFKYALM